jgi:hypothetical protein
MKLVLRLLLAGVVAVTAGCVGWRPVSTPAQAPDAPLRLGAALVTHGDGATVELHSVVVSADSVVGWRVREPRAGERLALARSEVRHIERHGLDFRATAGLAVLIAAAALWAALMRGV